MDLISPRMDPLNKKILCCRASVQKLLTNDDNDIKIIAIYRNVVRTKSSTSGDYPVVFVCFVFRRQTIDAFILLTQRSLFVVEDFLYMYDNPCCAARNMTPLST